MIFHVQYFAILKDQAKTSQETVDSNASSPEELYADLKLRHRFTLGQESLKVAINDEFAAWNSALSDGDTIVFIPPVAGG